MVLLEVVVAAEDPDTAISGLRHRFGLSEVQAVAVLDLQFRRATRRDRGRLEEGRQEVLEELRRLESAGE